MRGTLLLLFAIGLSAADDTPATDDPFASYQQAIGTRLSAMIEREQAPAYKMGESVAIEPRTAPHEDEPAEVNAFARRFWGGREAELAAALNRLKHLRPMVEPILSGEGVPKQLIAIVLIESGARPLAVSARQARGLWQFIPETARRYGLTVNNEKDERVELASATRAAARYLRDLYGRFGDWPLSLAAYNAGQKTVEDALKKRRASTFWQLSSGGLLPAETRNYVPAVLAAMELLSPPQPSGPTGEAPHDAWVYASAGVGN